jgi:regulation of enolase protein 1 (concanavalin A-like superfamily)
LAYGATTQIQFSRKLEPGEYKVRIGNATPVDLHVYPHTTIDMASAAFSQYCSATAIPCNFEVDQQNNHFVLHASGTDFMHGEDSYGTVYLKQPVKGNFVATVKLVRFGDKTNPWFRAGLYVRNDMEKSFDTGAASLGSVLWWVTTGRVGMNWDRYGNGAMHWATSENHAKLEPYPMWLKLVRHGNSLSGFLSYDGKNWTVSRHTAEVPGIASAVHLGLAAGSCDQISYTVEFSDFKVEVEKEGWKK